MSLTTENILEQYASINDALDDYLDAIEDGAPRVPFTAWFVKQFEKRECLNILDHPDLPEVEIEDEDEEGGAGKSSPKIVPPTAPTQGYKQDPPTDDRELVMV